MLFPIRDSIPSRIKPIVTTGIIVACGLTFVYELFVGANLPALFDIAGFIPARLFDTLPAAQIPPPDYGLIGNLVTLVTSMFLHGGWMHLIGNMWFLYLGFWFLLQAFGGTVSMAAAPGAGGVAWFAHIGGFVFGVAVAFWVKQRGSVKPPQPRARVWYGG